MPNPLSNVMERLPLPHKARYAFARLRQEVVGLAHDYWKDGNGQVDLLEEADFGKMVRSQPMPEYGVPALNLEVGEDGLWRALAGEISEKMWGSLCVAPCDRDLTEHLLMPLGVTRDMDVLDLSAGLGGRMLRISNEFGMRVQGMEVDPDIASRVTEMVRAAGYARRIEINLYDPMNLASTRRFDCLLARETIYRVADKEKFVKLVADCCKEKAQISFTDYIVDPEVQEKPAILAWKAFEEGANPPSLVEMAEVWAKQGFTLRVHDDQTDLYKKEIVKGLHRLVKFLSADVKPSPETKKAINRRITTWAHRMAALQAGMKFYRFYGLR